ncbi:topoisomerase DNA-binding C4 zinc finger domain-containing protein [Salinirubellus salinus]|uniref:Topoisomerase DNA-binding C4 zinc finger domain-containing protein n=1 Tax=Salinirubellus salinus TaxID=1364945 RepID=A0A9E7R0Q9_9EURY|nr:topoisomerase DNA-binding C4 zinc finger domain-containing protein [Salinirubellus salinus]UWM53556.1 topoisomerase DNA-binding C4 zinc finger domain-containing protein [Salinirubellus salinus]
MSDPSHTRVLAGDCTTTFVDASDETRQRGRSVVVVKPDRTVLVHDEDGYQPAAWLTRPDALHVAEDPTVLTATDGKQYVRVTVHDAAVDREVPVSPVGVPVGTCPGVESPGDGTDDCDAGGECDGVLVRARGAVHCTDCDRRHGLPAGASVDDSTCACGLPRCRVNRGREFEVCLDRTCESLADAVREAFDRAWDCPGCGGDLRVVEKGGILVGCDAYPECDTTYSFPTGLAVGTCACGLPTFETGRGERCLDGRCEAEVPA